MTKHTLRAIALSAALGISAIGSFVAGTFATLMIALVALPLASVALLVPRFAMFRALGLTNTYVPLIAPSLIGTSPFYMPLVWMFVFAIVFWFVMTRLPYGNWTLATGGKPGPAKARPLMMNCVPA